MKGHGAPVGQSVDFDRSLLTFDSFDFWSDFCRTEYSTKEWSQFGIR